MKKISLDFDPIRIKEIQKIQKFEQRKYFKEQSEVLLGLGIEVWNNTPARKSTFQKEKSNFSKMLENKIENM